MIGDQTLFMRADMVEQAWRVVQPVLDAWAAEKADFPNYDSGRRRPGRGRRLAGARRTARMAPGVSAAAKRRALKPRGQALECKRESLADGTGARVAANPLLAAEFARLSARQIYGSGARNHNR